MSDSSQQAHAILKEIMLEVTGFDMDDLDSSASFMELGLDSLTLIQFSQSIKTRLKVKLSFRNMVEQASNIDALTEFIVQNASADVLAAEAPQEAAPQPAAEPEPEAAPQEAAPAPKAESVLPPVQMPQMPMPAMTLPPIQATAASGPPAEGLESIIQLQLQLMSMQVAMLQGTPVSQVMPATEVSPEATAAPDIPAPQSSEPLITEVPSAPKTEAPTATVEKASPKELADAAEKTKRKRFGPYKPIRRNQDGSLTEVQKRHLDTLVEKITSLSPTSKQLTQEYRENFADPRSISGFRLAWKEMVYQIAIERSRGSKLWDMDGNEYIDIAMGFGLNLLGQSPDYVTKALEEQLQRGVETGPLSPIAGKTARMFSELTGHERVTFCNTGSEAVMAAIRLARTVSGRSKIALFTDAYHGNFDEVLVRANIIGGKRVLAPVAPGIPKSIGENLLVLEYTDPEALNEIRENADDLAAILVEPVQSAHPDVQPHEFLHQLRDLATEMDIALIVDEVISGFRAHQGGAQAYFGIKGDMATYGKIVGGGMPIGVLAGRHEYMDALDSGMWNFGDDSVPEADMTFFAGTFVRHPLAVAAAHAVLKHLNEEGPGLQEGLNQKTTELAADLNAFFQRRGVPIRITYFSSLFRFSFPPDLEFIDLLYYHLLGKGIYTRGFTENCFLSVAHSDEDIAHIIGAIKESIIELQDAGFLPDPPEDGAGVKVGKRFPLTEAQAEIFTSVQMSPEASCAFNEPFRMRLRGPFRLDHMRRAILDVMLRHESLHLRFAEDASYQEVSEPRPPIVPLVNLSHLDTTGQTEALEEAYARLASEPFDIANGPLVRVQIFRLSDEDHIITFSAHHLVSDGWSTDVMLGEIGEIYSTLCQNQSLELPPAIPFSDYAAEEVELADTTEVAETYAFWGEQFAQLPPALDLPTDRPRPARKSYKGATVTWKFDDQSYLSIKQRAADEGASLFAVLLSSFQLLMARLANQTDLAVAVATAGQMEIGADTMTGQCVNLLPVRAQMDMNASFRDYLEEAKGNLLDVLDHKEITFGSIIRHLHVPRDPSRLPLVEVNFNLDRDGRGMELYQLETEIAQTPKKAVNFDIFFNLNEQNDHLLVDCDYNADLFDEETIQRWMTYFEHLMEDIAANPEKPMAELNMMPETEVDKLLKDWNSTEMEYPRDATVQELIDAQAARTPDAMAVICGHRKLTYGELEQQSNQLAHHLRDMGIGTGNLVGVCLERCIEMPVALLGILKSGAAYVPLDPDYPTQRLDYMAKDAGLQALITQHNLIDRLPSLDATMICIDTDREAIASNSTDLSERHSGPEDTAYIIYTSGSAGNPKGVQIPHRALTNFLCSMQREPGMTAEDTLLSVTTLSFDISGLELYLPLITGANVAIASMEEITDGRQLAQALETYQATQMQATPAT